MRSMSSRRAGVRSRVRTHRSDFAAPVAVLVNNAVWARFSRSRRSTKRRRAACFAVGVEGMFWTTQAAVPQMARNGGGAIVNLTSVSAFHPAKDSIAYSAVKAGVTGLTRASATELGPRKIRVNAIAPGMIGTPASIAQFDEATIATRQDGDAARPVRSAGRDRRPRHVSCQRRGELSAGAVVTADGGWTVPAR